MQTLSGESIVLGKDHNEKARILNRLVGCSGFVFEGNDAFSYESLKKKVCEVAACVCSVEAEKHVIRKGAALGQGRGSHCNGKSGSKRLLVREN